MKKLLTVTIVTLLLTTALWAESWLQPKLNFTTEMFKGSDYFFSEVDNYPDWTVVQKINVGGTAFGWLFVEGDFNTFMQPPWSKDNAGGSGFFAPYQIDYGTRLGITHWGVSIGWEHFCYHPVQTDGDDYTERYGGESSWYAGFDAGTWIENLDWTLLRPELRFKFKYIYSKQALLKNHESGYYAQYALEPVLAVEGTVGFTLFKYLWSTVDFNMSEVKFSNGDESVQIDYRISAGLTFGGVRIGYYYSDYHMPDGQIMPVGNWYGANQGVILEIDLARITAWSRRNR